MKRLIALILVAAALFYGAWPAYSGASIRAALEARDASALSEWVDFEAVRQSMRPAITVKVESTLDAAAAKAGPSASKIYAALKSQMMPKIVEAALSGAVTPDVLIRLYAERGTLKDILNKRIGDQVSKSGGGAITVDAGSATVTSPGADAGGFFGGLFGGKSKAPASEAPAPPATQDSAAKPSASWRNIRGLGFNGPLEVYVDLAKDPASVRSDLRASMSFRGNGWVLTGLEPQLQ